MVCSCRRIFLFKPSVSCDVDKSSAISSFVLGVSSQGCCRVPCIVHRLVPLAALGMMSHGILRCCCPFCFHSHIFPLLREGVDNQIAIKSEMFEVPKKVVSPTQVYRKGVSMFNSMEDKWQRFIEWLSHTGTLLSAIITLECPNVPSTNL